MAIALTVPGVALLGACGGARSDAAAAPEAVASTDPRVGDALSAAPPSITADATVEDYPSSPGAPYRLLRKGTGAWTCFPTGTAPGDGPACFDRNAMLWLDAFYSGRTPDLPAPGIIYRMRGGSDPSLTDPYATAPPAGSTYYRSPPYIVVIPAGDPRTLKPDAAAPGSHEVVMWGGTSYAHLHVPLP